VDITVEEGNAVGDRVVGTVTNQTSSRVTGPIGVSVLCLTEAGDVLGHYSTFTNKDDLLAGESAGFQADLFGDECPAYLIGASGFAA